jgi:cobaltochelatase CobS
MTITVNTPVPAAVRGSLRVFVKSLPGWIKWIEAKGIASRDAKNSELLEFGLNAGYETELADILSGGSNASSVLAVNIPSHSPQATSPVSVPDSSRWTLNDILAPIDAFLSPIVRQELDKALAPVIDAALNPVVVTKEVERIVEVEKIVERLVQSPQAMPQTPAGQSPYAVPGKKVTLGSLFGVKGMPQQVTLWDSFGAAPLVDPFYVVDPAKMSLLGSALERGTNVWLAGPGGSGKSSMPEQFAAKANRPFVKLGFTRQTEVASLVGSMGLKDGATVWEDGALVAAMRRPGTIILLDELTLAPAGVQAVIQLVADDHRSITVPETGEKVVAAPGVVFVVADNTKGFGDETGRYAGTNQSNAALVNRFKRMLVIDYMAVQAEAQALSNHTGAPLEAAEYVAGFMNRARRLPEMETVVLSLRQMTGFVQTVQDGFTAKQAFEVCFLNQLPSVERAAIEALATLDWGREFDRLMSGAPVSAKASNSPAASAFDDEVSQSFDR